MRKLNKKYLDYSKNLGVFERSYVLCHDDDTAELFLYFCKDYESFFNSDKKDAKKINPKLSILFYDRKKLIDKEVYPSLNLYVDGDTKFDTNIKY